MLFSQLPAWMQTAKDGGFTDTDIQEHMAEVRTVSLEAGFTDREVDEELGIPQFDPTPLETHFKSSLTEMVDSWKKPLNSSQEGAPLGAPPDPVMTKSETGEVKAVEPPKHADTFLEAVDAGFQMSSVGLLARGALPNVVMGDEADWAMRIGNQLGMVYGDFPAMMLGAFAAPLGAPAGPVGMAAAAGAGSFALQTILRESLVEKYQKGEVVDFKDFWTRTSAVFMKTLQSGVVGGVSMGMGKAAGAAAGPMLDTTAKMATEIMTMVGLGKALDGQVPKISDFTDAAIVIGALHGTGQITSKLQNIYAKTGVLPADVAEQALKDPVFRQEILGDGINIPAAYEHMVDPAAKAEGVTPIDTLTSSLQKLVTEEGGSVGAPPKTPEIVRSDAQKELLSTIGEQKPAKKSLSLDQAYAASVDDLHAFKVWQHLATGGEKLSADKDMYIAARLTRGNAGRATYFIMERPFDFKTGQDIEGAKGMKEILEPVAGDLEGLRAYVIAKRTVNLVDRGIEAFGDNTATKYEAAKKYLAEPYAAKFEKAHKEIVEHRNHALQYMVDAGIFSKEMVEQLKRDDPDYAAPLYRVMEEAEGRFAGKGMTVRNPLKAIEGSDLLILDPIESLIKDDHLFIELAERNRVLSHVVDIGKEYDVPPELLEKVVAAIKPIDVLPEEIAKHNEDIGHDGTVAGQLMTIFRPQKLPLAENEFAVYVEGKRQVYRAPIELVQAIKGMNAQTAGFLLKLINKPMKWLKAGTTIVPEFGIKNFTRDQFSAFFFSKNGYIPIVDFFMGMGEIVTKGDAWKNAMKGGGFGAEFTALDRDYINENLINLEAYTSVRKRVWNAVTSPKRVLQLANSLVENSTRVGEMRRSMKNRQKSGMKDVTPREGMVEGSFGMRELTVDFQRKGFKMVAFNSAVPFLNPKVQGLDRTVRAFKEDPVGMIVKGGVVATISTLLWLANKDDKRIKESPRWLSDLFWQFGTDKWERISAERAGQIGIFARQREDGGWEENNGTIHRLPKPDVMGVVFGSGTERMLDLVFKNDPKAFKEFQETMLESVSLPYMATAITPFIETANNENSFTQAPIVPANREGLLPEYQYTEYTSETAKLIAKFIPDVKFGKSFISSPAIVDNWIRTWSGAGGAYVVKAIDEALYASGVATPVPNRPDATLADKPVIKAFVSRFPSANSRSITDFRENYRENQRVIDTIHFLAKQGKAADVERLQRLNENNGKLVSLVGIDKSLNKIKHSIEGISRDPKIQSDQKRQLMEGLYMQMINIAIQGNETIEKLRKNLNTGR